VFPHHLSSYSSIDGLPPVVNDVKILLDEVEDWLQYFLEAKPQGQGGDIYMAVLIGLSIPFPKFIKKLSPWCKEKYGLWSSSLQSEKLVLLRWLLFSTNLMDTELLKLAIATHIYDIPVGLRWKMIHMGTQGKVKPEDQIKALHVYIDADNVNMVKPLLSTLYLSKLGEDHNFPMGIWM